MSDADLLERHARHGDPEAFAELVRRHAGMVHGVCRRVLGGDSDAADDAAQAAFILLSRKAAALPPGTVVAGWLFRTAEGVSRNLARMRARRRRHEQEAAMRATADRPATSPWSEIAPQLDAAVAALPAAERDAVTMRFLRGLGRAEAAAELGCPAKTLDTRLASALARLRRKLERSGLAVGTALPALLEAHAAPPTPPGLTEAIGHACSGASGAAHAAASAYAGTLWWAKAKLAAAAVAAAVVLPLAVVASLPPPAPTPTAAAMDPPPPGAQPFTPVDGTLIVDVPLPQPHPPLAMRLPFAWEADGKHLVAVRADAAQDRCEICRIAVADGSVQVLARRPLSPDAPKELFTLSGRLVLTVGEQGSLIDIDLLHADGAGAGTTLTASSAQATAAEDGSALAWLAYGADAEVMELWLLRGIGRPQRIALPLAPLADGEHLGQAIDGFDARGRLRYQQGVVPAGLPTSTADWKPYLCDAVSSRCEPDTQAPDATLEPGETVWQRHPAGALSWRLPGGCRLAAVAAAGAAPASLGDPIDPGPDGPRVAAAPLHCWEVRDAATGAVRAQATFAAATLDGGDLWPQAVSADGRYVLASVFHQWRYGFGAPWGTWEPQVERALLVDLHDGTTVPMTLDPRTLPRYGALAVMSPSRELLVLGTSQVHVDGEPDELHGVFRFPFAGGPGEDLAPTLHLAPTWTASEAACFPRACPDRLTLVTRPEPSEEAPGERQLLVWWNQARPLSVRSSAGPDGAPAHAGWSPDGRLLAFTAEGRLLVWRARDAQGHAPP